MRTLANDCQKASKKRTTMHCQWISTVVLAALWLVAGTFYAAAESADTSWIDKSNEHAQMLLAVLGVLSPESAAQLGVDGLDENITDMSEGMNDREEAILTNALANLERSLANETNRKVKEDLRILIDVTESYLRTGELDDQYLLPYTNVGKLVFNGINFLLTPQVSRDRYPAAIVRLQRYAGIVSGYEPFTELAKDRSRERFEEDGLVGPFRGEVEQDLEQAETFITGIQDLFVSADLDGWEEAYTRLAAHLHNYSDWVRAEILPRSRDNFQLPLEIYSNGLRDYGIKEDPEVLIDKGKAAYEDIIIEMDALAPLVAEKMDYETNDYREIISRLRVDGTIGGDEVLDYYRSILSQIEEIIVSEELVTLPERNAGIRMASAAETAANPVPHLESPRLIGNTGEFPFFVLPLLEKNEDGSWQQNGFVYEAFAWTLTAHEARPGHELQFSRMIESGVSIARGVFAKNSANVEGWGVYSEWTIMYPYMPIEAQLVSVQSRLWRAARMFLDPQLNLGLVTAEEAKRLLVEGVGLGEDVAQSEIDRYTFRAPGQATSYYFGYSKMLELRSQVELKLKGSFDQQAYHDFVLDQGLLPLDILESVVMDEFIPSQMHLAEMSDADVSKSGTDRELMLFTPCIVFVLSSLLQLVR